MNSTDLTRPYLFSPRPHHKENIDSYSRRLLRANFETEDHRRALERAAQALGPRLNFSERWFGVIEAKSGRALSKLKNSPITGIAHADGSSCVACYEGIVSRVLCVLCARGAIVEQHPHFDQNVCLQHRRWVGPNSDATQQVTVSDDAIRAEIRFRKLRRAGLIDVPLYMLLQNSVVAAAPETEVSELYPKVISLVSAMTSDSFGAIFFDPRKSFDDAFEYLSATVETELGRPHPELVAQLWMRFRPTVLGIRESREQNRPFERGSAHDLPISRAVALRFQSSDAVFEPFTGYLAALPKPLPGKNASNDMREVHLYALSTSATRGSLALICDKGHRTSRVPGKPCQVCNNTLLSSGYNDLMTRRPDVGRQWHPLRNGKITARDVFHSSHTKFWWLCDEGHDFRATPSNRTSGDSSCSVCLNRDIQGGVNDVGFLFPLLAVEWDYAKNSNHAIETIAPGSNLLVWWKCPVGHSYRKTVGERTRGGGCHHCPRITSRARTIVIARPDLAAELHPTANLPLTPETITIGSRRECQWICPAAGHQYGQVPERRNAGYGCPYCSGQRFEQGKNDFSTMFPELAAEWHSKLNGVIEPCDHIARSRKVWWECAAEGHKHSQTIQQRIRTGGCPLCDVNARVASFPRAT